MSIENNQGDRLEDFTSKDSENVEGGGSTKESQETAVEEGPTTPEQAQEKLDKLEKDIENYEGPKSELEIKQEIKKGSQEENQKSNIEHLKNITNEEETQELQQKMKNEEIEVEQINYSELKKKKEYFQKLNRDKEIIELDQELDNSEEFSQTAKEIDKQTEEGSSWKVEEKWEGNENFEEFKRNRQEKFKLETLNEFVEAFPETEYYLFAESGSGETMDKEMNMLIMEPDPNQDPEKQRKFREEVFKKFIAMSDDNQIGLGEKFTAHSEKDFAYFNVVFAHKNQEGEKEYESSTPTSKEDSLNKEESIGGVEQFDLNPQLNDQGTYEEISWKDEGIPSGPENFYFDTLYNGKHLEDDQEFEQKLSDYTLKGGELSERQQQAINAEGVEYPNNKEEFLSEEQAKHLKEKREEILENFSQMEKNFLSEDKQEIQENKLPEIEGVESDKVKEIFNEFTTNFLYSYDGENYHKRDKIFAYPDQPQSNLEIIELANNPEVIDATHKLQEKTDKFNEKELREKVAEVAKSMIAESKDKPKDEYWKEFGKVKEDMLVR